MSYYQEGAMPLNCGINPNVLNDFGQQQYTQQNFNVANHGDVRLLVFSPQTIPAQVARSFVYQFTPEFIDSVKSQPTLAYAVGNMGVKNNSIINAILPDAGGMVMNTSTLQSMWSFVLIIDTPPEVQTHICTPGIRQIAMGYCSAEPINPATLTPNPSCILMFTHNSITTIKRAVGSVGAPDGMAVYIPKDVDLANESTSMLYNEKVLLGTPKELMLHSQQPKFYGTDVVDYSSLDLNNTKCGAGQASREVGSDIKSPKSQLSSLMSAIDTGIDHTATSIPVLSKFTTNELGSSPLETAFTNSLATMPSSNPSSFTLAFDASMPASLNELIMKFPHIQILPFRVNPNTPWDATNQVAYSSSGAQVPIASPRSQMCYLASVVVQACCSMLGFSSVAFSYRRVNGDGFQAGRQEAFQFSNLELIVPRDAFIMEEFARRFRIQLGEQLFDVIDSLLGDFEIHVMANMGGDILINLKLYNYPDPQDGTYYQTSARYSGYMNPMIGNIATINNNVTQITGMTEALCGNGLDLSGNAVAAMMTGSTQDMGLDSSDISVPSCMPSPFSIPCN